ncbi:F-box/kelch-repeat protein At5g15710-like [Abrus precatorius]|uniref:F-box/kelch-repeat protein At5g15710-like n=1 Tax=Abrus precatorius TaxID=3816 RepID=A0A8B8KM04_ABRPR|nr:F-box/kelch-repeat protein At5g15710-like [Abrus precatorius]
MWSNLPFDLLTKIFSFLSPDTLARARSTCKNWHTCSKAYPLTPTTSPWFLALPIRNHKPCLYVHNPVIDNWHQLSLQFLPLGSIRLVATIGNLLLLRLTNSTSLQLGLCNPFTTQFRYLPRLHVSRTNPAVGVAISEPNHDVLFPSFRIYVAGGMSEAAPGGATYEHNVEMYDSRLDTWQVVGSMPVEFAVRLTVWTPNENVYIEDTTTLYWITSARAYSVMEFGVGSNRWRELGVPNAESLEFATLVRWNGALALVGGTCGGSACIWELNEGDTWCLVDKVPSELGLRLLSGKRNWESVKCVGSDDAICLYRDLGTGMLVCKRVRDMCRWEWVWVDGCGYIKGKQVPNCPIRGALIHPTLASSLIF